MESHPLQILLPLSKLALSTISAVGVLPCCPPSQRASSLHTYSVRSKISSVSGISSITGPRVSTDWKRSSSLSTQTQSAIRTAGATKLQHRAAVIVGAEQGQRDAEGLDGGHNGS